MCFTIPKKIVSKSGTTALLDDGKHADISGIPECDPGDYIFVTSGIAVAKLTAEEGISMRSLIKETNAQLQKGR